MLTLYSLRIISLLGIINGKILSYAHADCARTRVLSELNNYRGKPRNLSSEVVRVLKMNNGW